MKEGKNCFATSNSIRPYALVATLKACSMATQLSSLAGDIDPHFCNRKALVPRLNTPRSSINFFDGHRDS